MKALLSFPYFLDSFKSQLNNNNQFSSVQSLSHIWPPGLQHARLPCPSPTPGAYSNSCPLSQWCHPTISFSVATFNLSQHQGFSNESVLHIRWPKYWSFSSSISLSNEYSGLISLRMDWFDHLAVQGTLKSPLQHKKGCSVVSVMSHSLQLYGL